MKQKKFILFIIFMFFFAFMSVSAKDFSIQYNASKEEIEISVDGEFNNEKSYFLKFIKDKDKQINVPQNKTDDDLFNKNDLYADDWFNISLEQSSYGKVSILNDFYMYADYNYARLVECDSNTCTLNDKILDVNKPKLLEYKNRYHFYLDSYNISLFPLYQFGSLDIKYNIKIGKVNDEELMLNIINDDYDVDDLLDYALNDTKAYSTELTSQNNEKKLSDFEIEPCQLYYVYILNDNEDGLYETIEDVIPFIGFKSESGSDFFRDDITDYTFYCDIKKPSNSESKIDNPKTKDFDATTIVVGIILLLCFMTFGIMKLRKIEDKE